MPATARLVKKEIKSVDGHQRNQLPVEGLAADVFRELGRRGDDSPAARIVPIMDRGSLIAAGLTIRAPTFSLAFRRGECLHDGEPPSACGCLGNRVQQGKARRAAAEIKSIMRHAAFAAPRFLISSRSYRHTGIGPDEVRAPVPQKRRGA